MRYCLPITMALLVLCVGCELSVSPDMALDAGEETTASVDDATVPPADGAVSPDSVLPADAATDLQPGEDLPPPPCTSDEECDDGIDCTTDNCNPSQGCLHVPFNGACDDAIDCTEDTCDPTEGCLYTPSDAACDDGIDCTVDSCDPAEGCAHSTSNEICDDGIDCTQDWCNAVQGCNHAPDPALCDAPAPCEEVACEPGVGCVYTDKTGNCSDGDGCTFGDFCLHGECVPGAVELTNNCLFEQNPNVGSCSPGKSSWSARATALARVNWVRSLSGLPPVGYDSSSDGQTQAASLIMAANSQLSHEPPSNWYCWTQAGFDGAKSSNLHMGWSTQPKSADPLEAVDAFLIDNNVESLGHRRWVLDPFLKKVSYGALHGNPKASSPYPYIFAATLKVIYPQSGATTFSGDFVAYPQGDYPSALFLKGWYLSFSMVADKNSSYANSQVDVSAVTIAVTKPGGGALPVSSVKVSNQFYGVPNHVQWKVSGLQDNVTYDVTVGNLKYKGKTYSFPYTFRLVP